MGLEVGLSGKELNMRKCIYCKKMLSLDKFTKDSSKGSGYKSYCKKCASGVQLIRNVKRKYNLEASDYDKMLHKQGECCAICGIKSSDYGKKFSIDHCHKTMKVRALLCNNCNVGIGLFKENLDTLVSAISYLMRHNN